MMDSLEAVNWNLFILYNFTYLRTIQNILMTRWLSGERSLPFGLLGFSREKGEYTFCYIYHICTWTVCYVSTCGM